MDRSPLAPDISVGRKRRDRIHLPDLKPRCQLEADRFQKAQSGRAMGLNGANLMRGSNRIVRTIGEATPATSIYRTTTETSLEMSRAQQNERGSCAPLGLQRRKDCVEERTLAETRREIRVGGSSARSRRGPAPSALFPNWNRSNGLFHWLQFFNLHAQRGRLQIGEFARAHQHPAFE
jgi:hypothetical protein